MAVAAELAVLVQSAEPISVVGSQQGTPLPVYSLQDVAQHDTHQSCWIAICGEEFDFTAFMGRHPGGARALLRHAGTDASDVFTELHSQSIFAEFGPAYRIGFLAGGSRSKAGWRGLPPLSRGWEGLPGQLSDVSPTTVALPSPFPHEAFTGSGLETFRFHWSVADRLLRSCGDGRSAPAPEPSREGRSEFAMFRQKSNLSVLRLDRDWLHVGAPEVYAAEMRVKEALLREHTAKVYATTAETEEAEWEVLQEVCAWVARRHPDRFQISPACRQPEELTEESVVETLTPGYQRQFLVGDWRKQGLRLLGMLVQEDTCVQTTYS